MDAYEYEYGDEEEEEDDDRGIVGLFTLGNLRALDPRLIMPLLGLLGLLIVMAGVMAFWAMSGGGAAPEDTGSAPAVVGLTQPSPSATVTASATPTSTNTQAAPSAEANPTDIEDAFGTATSDGTGGGDGTFPGGTPGVTPAATDLFGEDAIPPGRFILSDVQGLVSYKLRGTDEFVQARQPITLAPGDLILVSEGGSAKMTMADGSIAYLGSQTQVEILQSDINGVKMDLEFGKVWHVIMHDGTPLSDDYVYSVDLPNGEAYSFDAGSFMSTEWNTTNQIGVITCLYSPIDCAYATDQGQVLLESLTQAQAGMDEAPIGPSLMNDFELQSWLKYVEEVTWLTPTPTSTGTVTATSTQRHTPTYDTTLTIIARTHRAELTEIARTLSAELTGEAKTATAEAREVALTRNAQLSGTQASLLLTDARFGTQIGYTATAQVQGTQNSIFYTQEAATAAIGATQTAVQVTQGSTATQLVNTQIAATATAAVTQTASASPRIEFQSANYVVGESDGSVTVTMQLLNPPTTDIGTITVDYRTANGTATDTTDYTSVISSVSFAWNGSSYDTTATATVNITSDTASEPSETFTVDLSNPIPATTVILGTNASTTVTINDDDLIAKIGQTTAVTISEIDGTVTNKVSVVLSSAAPSALFAYYTFTPTGANPVIIGDSTNPDADIRPETNSGRVQFNAGDTEKFIEITAVNDTVLENDETFVVTLTGIDSGSIDLAQDTVQVTVLDNDSLLVNMLDAALSVDESAGAGSVIITAQLDAPVPVGFGTQIVPFTITDGTATGAVACSSSTIDYATATSGEFNFTEGSDTATFTISEICDDTSDEADETFTMTLGTPAIGSRVALGSQLTTTVTILDNDLPPVINFATATTSVTEGSTFAVNVEVSLSGAANQDITVQCVTQDNTAVAGEDYTATTSTLTFSAGSTQAFCQIPITNDTIYELGTCDAGNNCNRQERFAVTLQNATNATLGNNNTPHNVIITDNETQLPFVVFTQPTYSVNQSAGTVSIGVTVSDPISGQVDYTYQINDGTAIAGTHYSIPVSNPTTRSIPGYPTSQVVSFDIGIINGGITDGNPRQFTITMIDAVNATVPTDGSQTITVTINP